MNRRVKKPTLAPTAIDAIVVALSPALIIGMVSCLVFFLVVAFYRGEYDQRLMYILGLFTLATVLIARIAIESGRTYANAFSLPLAIVSVIAMFRFVTIAGPLGPISPLINIVLLGVAWYLADRITFDCTSVDERDSGVQQGLLQSLGLLKKDGLLKASLDSPAPAVQTKDAEAASQSKSSGTAQAKKKKKKRHNPGVWVLYFSLLAFPLFGLGQLTIPDEASRSTAFYLLVGYLGCALALLSTTSFISTRRYLRHRGASMPAEMSRSWLGYAGVGIVALLVICLLLPLPGRSLGLVGLPFELKSPDGLQTSRWGWGDEGVEPTESDSESDQPSDGRVVQPDAENKGNAGGKPQADGKGPPQASEQAKQDASSAAGNSGKSQDGSSQDGSSQEGKSQGSDSKGGQSQDNRSQDNPSRENQPQGGQSQENQSSNSSPDNASPSNSNQQQANQQQANQQQANQQQANQQQANQQQANQQQANQQQLGNDNNRTSEDRGDGQPPDDSNKPDTENANADNAGDADRADNAQEDNAQEDNAAGDNAQRREGGNSDQAAPRTPPPTSSPSSDWFNWLPSGLADIIKWLTIAALALIVIFYAITHPREVLQLWRDLLDFISRLFGGRTAEASAAAGAAKQTAVAAPEPRPFRSFANPFANQLQGWTPEQAIHQTFAALEAWGAEQGRRRQRDETAAEFAKHLGRRIPSVDPHAATAARMLDSLMFAGWKPTPQEIAPLAKVWQALASHRGLAETSSP